MSTTAQAQPTVAGDPLLRIVGSPTPEEVAAVVLALRARVLLPPPTPPLAAPGGWGQPGRAVRHTAGTSPAALAAGAGWWQSGLPR